MTRARPGADSRPRARHPRLRRPTLPAPPRRGDLARDPRAQLVVIDGLGHELPSWAWDEVLPALIDITR